MSRSLTVLVAAVAAMIGTIGPVAAQSQGRRTTGAASDSGADSGRLVRPGSSGNCAAGVVCADPPRGAKTAVTPATCDPWRWVTTRAGSRVRKCLER